MLKNLTFHQHSYPKLYQNRSLFELVTLFISTTKVEVFVERAQRLWTQRSVDLNHVPVDCCERFKLSSRNDIIYTGRYILKHFIIQPITI